MRSVSKDKLDKLITTIGHVVEKHRKKQDKTAYKISAESLLSKSSWREVELGMKDFRISTLWKVAEGLDVSLGDLLNEVKKELGEDFSLTD